MCRTVLKCHSIGKVEKHWSRGIPCAGKGGSERYLSVATLLAKCFHICTCNMRQPESVVLRHGLAPEQKISYFLRGRECLALSASALSFLTLSP